MGFWAPTESEHMLMKLEINCTEVSEVALIYPEYRVQILTKDNN
jgi:hypothetical protein